MKLSYTDFAFSIEAQRTLNAIVPLSLVAMAVSSLLLLEYELFTVSEYVAFAY